MVLKYFEYNEKNIYFLLFFCKMIKISLTVQTLSGTYMIWEGQLSVLESNALWVISSEV